MITHVQVYRRSIRRWLLRMLLGGQWLPSARWYRDHHRQREGRDHDHPKAYQLAHQGAHQEAHHAGCFTHYGRNRSTRILVNNNNCGKKSGTTYSDSQSICGGSGGGGYKFGTLGQVACPSGYSRIYDEATCRKAMTKLGGSVQSVGKHCWQSHPAGCFTHYGRNRSTRILVNNNNCGKKSGTTYSDSQSICSG